MSRNSSKNSIRDSKNTEKLGKLKSLGPEAIYCSHLLA
jgi:hypothetical protein